MAIDLAVLASRLAGGRAPLARIVVFGTVGSTQDEAASLAGTGAPAGTLVLAAAQTSGRGRVGRSWHSPAGGLYASLILRPPGPPDRWPALTVLAGTAVAESLAATGVVDVSVKWPNDVRLDARKVAGLLAEAHVDAGFAVLGIGLNVALEGELPRDLRESATDLASHLPSGVDPIDACASVLEALAVACVGAASDVVVDPARASRWLDGSREVTVAGVRGRPAGISAQGELLLETPDGTCVRVSMGEVNDAGGH